MEKENLMSESFWRRLLKKLSQPHPSVSQLEKELTLMGLPRRDVMEWVAAFPRVHGAKRILGQEHNFALQKNPKLYTKIVRNTLSPKRIAMRVRAEILQNAI